MTSILTSSKNDPHVFCRTWHGLSSAVYRISMRCVVLEISRGVEINPPAGSRLAQTPAGARVNSPILPRLPLFFRRERCRTYNEWIRILVCSARRRADEFSQCWSKADPPAEIDCAATLECYAVQSSHLQYSRPREA